MDDIVYIPKSMVIEQHNYVIDKSGGSHGIYSEKDGLLDSILEHIQNNDYFPSFLDKLNKLLIGIAEYHIFIDGNKRTAISIGALFLKLNGFSDNIISRFMCEMENYIIWVTEHRISEELFQNKLEYIIYDIDEPEEFRFKIIRILSSN
jgi:death-on-curing family protein